MSTPEMFCEVASCCLTVTPEARRTESGDGHGQASVCITSKLLRCIVVSFLLMHWAPLSAALFGMNMGPAQNSPAAASRPQSERWQHDFQAAVAAYASRRYIDAEHRLQSLIAARPNSFEVNELAGLVYGAEGHDEKANHYLTRAVRINPTAVAAVTALAANLIRLHRSTEAEVQLKKAAELEPTSNEANHNLGEFYVQLGRLPEAIPYLERAQELNADDYNNGYDLALAYEQTGHTEQARRQLEALIKIHDTAELHDLLGDIAEKSNNYMLAVTQYEQAARQDPSEGNIFDWGSELLLHQAFEPSLAVFQAGLERYPRSLRLQMSRGVALLGLGRFDESADAFCLAYDLDPSDPLPLIFLGKSAENFSASALENVRKRMQRFVDGGLRNARVDYFYAITLLKREQGGSSAASQAEIESLLKNAIAVDPAYAEAYVELGVLYAAKRQYSDAVEQYQRAENRLQQCRRSLPVGPGARSYGRQNWCAEGILRIRASSPAAGC
jgi:tetratricopeptide (TPR) repeat protein